MTGNPPTGRSGTPFEAGDYITEIEQGFKHPRGAVYIVTGVETSPQLGRAYHVHNIANASDTFHLTTVDAAEFRKATMLEREWALKAATQTKRGGNPVRKLRDQYRPGELPPGFVTSVDVSEKEFERLKQSGRYELYTQVDAEGKIYYFRGPHFVNRTGVYALVPKPASAGPDELIERWMKAYHDKYPEIPAEIFRLMLVLYRSRYGEKIDAITLDYFLKPKSAGGLGHGEPFLSVKPAQRAPEYVPASAPARYAMKVGDELVTDDDDPKLGIKKGWRGIIRDVRKEYGQNMYFVEWITGPRKGERSIVHPSVTLPAKFQGTSSEHITLSGGSHDTDEGEMPKCPDCGYRLREMEPEDDPEETRVIAGYLICDKCGAEWFEEDLPKYSSKRRRGREAPGTRDRGKLVKSAPTKFRDSRDIVHIGTVSLYEHHPGYFTVYLEHLSPPLPAMEGQLMGGTYELAMERFTSYAVPGTKKDLKSMLRDAIEDEDKAQDMYLPILEEIRKLNRPQLEDKVVSIRTEQRKHKEILEFIFHQLYPKEPLPGGG